TLAIGWPSWFTPASLAARTAMTWFLFSGATTTFPCCPEKKDLSPRCLTALRLQGPLLNSLWTAGTSIRCHHDVPVSLSRKIVTACLNGRICRGHRNRQVIPVHPLHRRDKTIAQSRARLDKSRALRRVPQDAAELVDRRIQAVVERNIGVWPEFFAKRLSPYHLSSAFN